MRGHWALAQVPITAGAGDGSGSGFPPTGEAEEGDLGLLFPHCPMPECRFVLKQSPRCGCR